MKKIAIILSLLIVIITVLILITKKASDMDEEIIKNSPDFKNGVAQNREYTDMRMSISTTLKVSWDLFIKSKRPDKLIPAVKTDLKSINHDEEIFVWLGHSSYLIQTYGKRILVDPVFTEAASPIPFINKPYDGTAIYSADDMPNIDYLIITHDHYDHLSKQSLIFMKDKVGRVVCGLGVGKYLSDLGYPEDKIIQLGWDGSFSLEDNINIYCLTTRHFSGRSLFSNNSTLWAAFVFETPKHKIYIGGDSGYGKHFKEAGERFGNIDIAFLENGQYNENWQFIHMMPEETLMAAEDLKAKRLMPVHNSKYKLSYHDWNEPLIMLQKLYIDKPFVLLSPMIGEKTPLWDTNYNYNQWWLK